MTDPLSSLKKWARGARLAVVLALPTAGIVVPPSASAEVLPETVTTTAVADTTLEVPVRDGTRLKTRYSLPGGEGPWPAVLVRLPYNRDDYWKQGEAQAKNAVGYAFVAQNLRGSRGSEGVQRPFYDEGWADAPEYHMHPDGVDSLRWLLAQPWCNGTVATTGASAPGFTAQLLAGATDRIACQFIGFAASKFYGQVAYDGGVLLRELVHGWTDGRSVPHVLDEWKDHPTEDDFWARFQSEARAPQMTAPAVHLGGWFDSFAEGTVGAFTSRQYHGGAGARGNQKLIMGPWTHYYTETGELTYPNPMFDFPDVERRFFAHWMHGEDNGIMDEPAVHYYVLGAVGEDGAPGNEWRTAEDWPPLATTRVSWHLCPENLLSPAPPPGGRAVAVFAYDPGDPLPTLGGRTLYPLTEGPTAGTGPGPHDQSRFKDREDVLAFRTAPLEQPIEICGRARVRLFVSTSAPDTDFAAKLLDVYPDGREMLMLDGIRRLKFRNGFGEPAPPLQNGEVAEVGIELGTISLIFNTGHRIGLHVSGGNYPRYEKNTNDGRDFPDKETPWSVATDRVHMGTAHPSALILPTRAPDQGVSIPPQQD